MITITRWSPPARVLAAQCGDRVCCVFRVHAIPRRRVRPPSAANLGAGESRPASAARHLASAGRVHPGRSVSGDRSRLRQSRPREATRARSARSRPSIELTVEFDLCPARTSPSSRKVAFSSNNHPGFGLAQGAHSAPDQTLRQDDQRDRAIHGLRWVPGDHITLVANPNYWGAPPRRGADRRSCAGAPKEPPSSSRKLQAGTVDGIDNVEHDDFPTLPRLTPPWPSSRARPSNILYLGMNVDQAPWDNEKVRQAIGDGHRSCPDHPRTSPGRARKPSQVLHPVRHPRSRAVATPGPNSTKAAATKAC